MPPKTCILILLPHVPIRLLPSASLQPIRDGPDDPADGIPVPPNLEALGHGANDVPGQAHAPLGAVSIVGRRARVSIARRKARSANSAYGCACERIIEGEIKARLRHNYPGGGCWSAIVVLRAGLMRMSQGK